MMNIFQIYCEYQKKINFELLSMILMNYLDDMGHMKWGICQQNTECNIKIIVIKYKIIKK